MSVLCLGPSSFISNHIYSTYSLPRSPYHSSWSVCFSLSHCGTYVRSLSLLLPIFMSSLPIFFLPYLIFSYLLIFLSFFSCLFFAFYCSFTPTYTICTYLLRVLIPPSHTSSLYPYLHTQDHWHPQSSSDDFWELEGALSCGPLGCPRTRLLRARSWRR